MVRNGCQGVTPSNLLQPFLVSFNPCLSFFTFFNNAKPPSLDLVGEIVHGSTDLLSMSRWGGGGTPLVQMLRQKKDTHGSAGCPFWRTSFTKQHLQLPFMSFLLLCQSLYVHLNSYTFIGNFFSL